MATRRFRIKAVANVAVQRGRCGERSGESEKFDEKTSTNSLTSTSDVGVKETISAEGANDNTLVRKLSEGSSLKEGVKSTQVCHLVQNSEYVSQSIGVKADVSDFSTTVNIPNLDNCHLPQRPADVDVRPVDNSGRKDVSPCNRTYEDVKISASESCCKTEVSIDSTRLEDASSTCTQNSDTTGTNVSSAPFRLPRKRMKPTVSLSLVNRKVKDNPTVEAAEQCTVSKIDHNSAIQVEEKQQTCCTISDLHKDVETDSTGMTIPAANCGTQNCYDLCEDKKKIDHQIASQICVGGHVSQTNLRDVDESEVTSHVVSVDTPGREPDISVSTTIHHSSVQSSSPAVESGEGSSPSVKCLMNQSVKDCGQLNSFRSRFIRPKPLLDSAARRSRTVSIGSASESDGEKKSFSSATTLSPPWQPRLIKTSRTRLSHVQAVETDKLTNASGASADESEDEHSSVSRAVTVSPPKKIPRLDSDGGSDTSHSEFSQEVSDENASPIKKSCTKLEKVTKRKEYLRRIIEIKKEISHKVSDGKVNKSRLTMFDLIYYNPVTNPMKSVQEPGVKTSGPVPTKASESETRLAEESVDEPEALEDDERSSTVPVPQVKVGPNGEIILDEQSLVIETTDAKKNWNDLQNSEVIMDYGTGTTTYNAYSKKRKSRTKDWNREETLRFYRALHTVGTDFLVMQSLFPKFTRKELKDRYKKEERINRVLVEKALRNPLTFDLTELQKEFERERLEEERISAQPKRAAKPRRTGTYRRKCSLFAALDSTDQGKVRSEGRKTGKQNLKVKPTKRKSDKHKDTEETHSEKKRKTDSTKGPLEGRPHSDCSNTMNGHVERDSSNAMNGHVDRDSSNAVNGHVDRNSSNAMNVVDDSESSNALNGRGDSESSVPEAACLTTKVKPTRSGRIPRPRIFEDFMTDVEEIFEETEITEICDRVTVDEICDSEPVADANLSEHEEVVESENVVVDEDTMATCESENENEEQNFVIAEDALTVQQSQVNLGSVYSNVKPGTLIVLATESPDNPGHQIFRVFMVSNNSETLPVSVTNNQASSTDTSNSVELGPLTDPVVSESSTNDCNSLQMSAESSS